MKSFLTLAVLVLVAATSLSAQVRIRMGQSIQGTLDTGSLKLDDGSYYDLYRYDSPGNETVVVVLNSSAFDAYLMAGTLDNGNFKSLGMDDDSGGGTDSRLEIRLDAPGAYYFRANTILAGETGAYTIRLSSAGSGQSTASRATGIKDLKIGETITDRLTSTNEVLDDGSYAQRYRVRLAQGQTVQITLQGDDFDAFLMLFDDQGERVAYDDDSAGGTDARIDHTASKTGDYIVLVNSLGEKEEGEFALFVEHKSGPRASGGASTPATAAPAGRQISIGQRVSGTLGAQSLKAADDTYYDAYLIRGVPNTTVSITLESADFDAYLVIGVPGRPFESLDTDDDSAGGTNSRLIFTFTDDRIYEIRANTLSEGETGAYTLLVSAGPARAATAPMRTITIDSRLTGTFSESSPTLDDGSHYEDFLITGAANTSVEISLLSGDFDAYLNFGKMDNGSFRGILTNDDCDDSGSNACIKYVFPDNGTYVIRANTLSEGETGAFSLWVVKKGMYTVPPVASLPALTTSRIVSGSITDKDPVPPGGTTPHKDYKITVARNETIELTLRSDDFDTVLTLLDGAYAELETDDDGAGGTDSRITYTFRTAGTYVVRVSPLSSDDTGAFRLEAKKK